MADTVECCDVLGFVHDACGRQIDHAEREAPAVRPRRVKPNPHVRGSLAQNGDARMPRGSQKQTHATHHSPGRAESGVEFMSRQIAPPNDVCGGICPPDMGFHHCHERDGAWHAGENS